MKSRAVLALSLSLAGGTLVAQDATVRSLLSTDLAGVPGRELSMITVEYPPGGADPVHTHQAQDEIARACHFQEMRERREGLDVDDWLA
jgi:hypothetical protein